MSAVSVVNDIYWVGAIDWNMRHFHGQTYSTPRGTTYNAYLIKDTHPTLVDGVRQTFTRELVENIKEVLPLNTIEYIVVNHIESDHSGAIPELLKLCPKARILCSGRAKEGLLKQYALTTDIQVVKTGDTVSIGERTLSFIDAPMIHWPDSMFTYIPEDKLLLPNDAFGQHYATSERFNDEVDTTTLFLEASSYFANILWPLSPVISKKINEIKKMDMPIDIIAPSHGIIWRDNPQQIIDAYTVWANNESKQQAVVVFETMWGSTEIMARRIAQGIIDQGVPVQVFDIARTPVTTVVDAMFESAGYCFGASTHDNDMLPTMAGFLHFVKGLKPKKRIAAVFGSYGWAGGAIKAIEQVMVNAGIEIAQKSLGVQHTPDEQNLAECYTFGKKFAEKILTKDNKEGNHG